MEDDEVGFTYFLNISYTQHKKDYPDDTIEFHDFSSICMKNWESLDEDAKKKITELASKEKADNEIKKERKPAIGGLCKDEPIALDSTDDEDYSNGINDNLLNISKIIEIGESMKKQFGQQYTYCKKPRSAYIYFVKAARVDLKDRIQCSKDNFVEISRAISSKWNELKVAQREIFEHLAMLDKRINGFRVDAAVKKKPSTSTVNHKHTSLFLKAKAEATEHHASTSNSSPIENLRNLLAARRARRDAERLSQRATVSATSRTKRKVKRRTKRSRAKKRKTTKTQSSTSSTTSRARVLPSTLGSVKSERFAVKSEKKFKIKSEIKVKRDR